MTRVIDEPSVTIELGHIYADKERFLPFDGYALRATGADLKFRDTEYAQKHRDIAESFGLSALRVALLDDVRARTRQRESEDSWRWESVIQVAKQSIIAGTETTESNTFSEHSFEKPARELVAKIQSMELPDTYRLTEDKTRLKIGTKSDLRIIRLQGYQGVDDPTFPSCEVLDLAWLQKRLTMAPGAVTILPQTDFYVREQENVAILANLVGVDTSDVQTIFIDQSGNEVRRLNWGRSPSDAQPHLEEVI